ncbi:SGNH/GDSL hydrolase family protein [Williamsia deligens]|uniref:SGNH/GDSL hydrolase family protein n=1 Tax=Williamsia deligens TaxID=321325 RepID=A0ABW3GEW4_9NOCA|nr:SGNH/GDSL hydrolase family protein [Williamsia deligens]MCP2196212.1 Lysophospholipase L1 [Williamsia deligens]
MPGRVDTSAPRVGTWSRFVAVGDSFPEGVGDTAPDLPNGVRGWADRLARILAGDPSRTDGDVFRYANLALRGKVLDEVVAEQLPTVAALRPDLIAVCAGANDLLRPSVDIDDLMDRYDGLLGDLASTGATVVTFTAFDTARRPLFAALRGRFAIYNELLREIVERRDLVLVDFWRLREFSDRRMWEFDRMHLSPDGHHQMALRVAEALGVEHGLAHTTLGAVPTISAGARRKDDRRWVTREAAPWVGRRLRGVSRGDDMVPRHPEWVEVTARSHDED